MISIMNGRGIIPNWYKVLITLVKHTFYIAMCGNENINFLQLMGSSMIHLLCSAAARSSYCTDLKYYVTSRLES